jgi:hypothetical protein
LKSLTLGMALAVAAFSVLASCENLGLDPSGKLACAPGPENRCPNGFQCLAGRCWRNGAKDGSTDLSVDGSADTSMEHSSDIATKDASTELHDAVEAVDASADNSGDLNTSDCSSGQCRNLSNGASCSTADECESGFCAAITPAGSGNVCCDSACSGSCIDGCAGGTCKFKPFRTSCGEIDSSPYSPRYFICDGDGNCDPPSFNCNGFGSVCAASQDVLCCADPTQHYMLGCVTPTTCASQTVGDFEMSCAASIDCPASTFCCSEQNSDILVSGCAANCQTFSTHGRDPTEFTHNQLCDLMRDPSCPAGKQCQIDSLTGLGICGL